MAKEKGWDNPDNEVTSNWWKANVPLEDKIFGTLIAKKQVKSQIPGQENKIVNVYDIKADEGSFHVLDDKKKVVPEAIVINPGEFYSVGGTVVIDRQMTNMQIGQRLGLKFIEEKPSKTKGFAPAKIVKVYAPKNEDGTPQMDEDFLAKKEVQDF